MQYAVLIQKRPDGKFQASVPVFPGLKKVGKSREETLRAVKDAIQETLEHGEWVYINVSEGQNPWMATAGMFADDPTLEPMLEEIYSLREAERE